MTDHPLRKSLWLSGPTRVWILAIVWAVPMYMFVLSAYYNHLSIISLTLIGLICVAVGWLFAWIWWYFFGKFANILVKRIQQGKANDLSDLNK